MKKLMRRLINQGRVQQQRVRMWWAERDAATRLFGVYLLRAVTNFNRYGLRWAAAMAYYTIFSIFPLTLLLAIGVSRLLGTAVAQQQIANALLLFLPESGRAADLLVESVQSALEQDTSFGIVALVGLVWSGLGLFSNVTASLDLIFRVPKSRSIWRQRLVAAAMIAILVVLVAASFLTSGVIALLSLFFLGQPGTWLTIAAWFLPFSLNMLIFLLVFRFVPAREVRWDAIWPAALVGAIGFELAKRGFSWYLANFANYQVVYGSIAAVIILLFWAYLLAALFLFSAELCAQLNEWLDETSSDTLVPRLDSTTPPPQLY